jgi:starvation-inducible DNA-binding protein
MKTLNSTLPEAADNSEAKNDISPARRLELTALLNQRLASALDLHLQMKQAHWNVKGPSFIGLHELFDKVAAAVDDYADKIAERIVQLGGIAEGTIRLISARTRLPDYPIAIADGMAHVEAVARSLAIFGKQSRHAMDEANVRDDASTADLFTEISRGIEQWLYLVQSHSQSPK